MIKKTSLNQSCGRDSEFIIGAFLKSFSIHKSSIGLFYICHLNTIGDHWDKYKRRSLINVNAVCVIISLCYN